MIRPLPARDPRPSRRTLRRQWRRRFIPLAILHVEQIGTAVIAWQTMETRWSKTHGRRLWRLVK